MEAAEIFGPVFLVLTLYGFWRWWKVSNMKRWSHTKATLIQCNLEAIRRSYRGVPYVCYVPHVRYSYEVNGAKYESNRLTLHNFFVGVDKDELGNLLGGAGAGDTVDAFFDPNHPGNVSLTLPSYAAVILSLFIGGFGLFLVAVLNLPH
jgi:hypothetical protein